MYYVEKKTLDVTKKKLIWSIENCGSCDNFYDFKARKNKFSIPLHRYRLLSNVTSTMEGRWMMTSQHVMTSYNCHFCDIPAYAKCQNIALVTSQRQWKDNCLLSLLGIWPLTTVYKNFRKIMSYSLKNNFYKP